MSIHKNSIKNDAISIFYSGLNECKPAKSLSNNVKLIKKNQNKVIRISKTNFVLSPKGKVFVIGAGKASSQMAFSLESKIKEVISKGIIITPYKYKKKCEKIEILEASHPLPDENGVNHTNQIISLAEKCKKNDLVIFLLSGGASSLLVKPAKGIELKEKSWLIEKLLNAGSTINELNCIRKHLSEIKAGQLALKIFPAKLITLYISDVIDNKLDVIGSGPTYGDNTTFKDTYKILLEKKLWKISSKNIRNHIEMGIDGIIKETPSRKSIPENKSNFFLMSDLNTALTASFKKAKLLGYKTKLFRKRIQGEAKEVGRHLSTVAKKEKNKKSTPYCFICGGETTVKVTGNGKGGRCQELALAFSKEICGVSKIVLLASGTDGKDGPTNASGAIVNGRTINSKKLIIDSDEALRNNNSNVFLESRKSLFKTGPTGTNVMDIIILLIR